MSPNGSFRRHQQRLVSGAANENISEMKAALEAGANVNGSPEQPLVPIVVAAIAGHAGTGAVNFLLKQGADPDMPVTEDIPCPKSDIAMAVRGERALHIAARRGDVKLVRLLLRRSRADPNTTDNIGNTPLMATCTSSRACVEVLQLLLEAGADPAVAKEGGLIPLHMAATNGLTDLVDILCSIAPATLNRCASSGKTPLFFACKNGHERTVSELLLLGAKQPTPLSEVRRCPLRIAVCEGFVGVVRVLIEEGGIRAVGGDIPLTEAICFAVGIGYARILQLLLTARGETGRSGLANTPLKGSHLLHYGAFCSHPAVVSVLLEAGADEAARGSKRRIPRELIGVHIGLDAETQMDRGKNVAIRRMMQRGPAYRARSWAWPSVKEADTGCGGEGDTAVAAAATTAVLPSPLAVNHSHVIDVIIFRSKGCSRFFVQSAGR